MVTIFRRDEVVGHAYVKHGIRIQYAVVSIAVYGGRLQHLTKTWSYDTIEEFNVDSSTRSQKLKQTEECPFNTVQVKMPKVAPFPYVKYSKLSHVTYFRLHLLVMIAYLTVCLFLSRRIRL